MTRVPLAYLRRQPLARDDGVRHNPRMTQARCRKLKTALYKGWERVQATARPCAINLLQHSSGSQMYDPKNRS
jgi:type I restriction enzyme M protein